MAVGGALLAVGLRPGEPDAAPVPPATFTDVRPAERAAPANVPRAAAPNRLLVPSLGIDAPVQTQPTRPGGDFVVPGDPDVVARWEGGAPIHAARGTTLMAGHVDTRGDPGALHGLHAVAPGALVATTDASGHHRSWTVVTLQVRRKEDLPVFSAAGPRRLVLLTCGGPVQRTRTGLGYRDNVIAVAEPLDAALSCPPRDGAGTRRCNPYPEGQVRRG